VTVIDLNTPIATTTKVEELVRWMLVGTHNIIKGPVTLADLAEWAKQHPEQARAVIPVSRYTGAGCDIIGNAIGWAGWNTLEDGVKLLVAERDAAVKRAEEESGSAEHWKGIRDSAMRKLAELVNDPDNALVTRCEMVGELVAALRDRVAELESVPVLDQLARSLGDLTRQLLAALPERKGPATAAELVAELAAERDALRAEVERLRSQLGGLKCQAEDDARVAASWMREVQRMRPLLDAAGDIVDWFDANIEPEEPDETMLECEVGTLRRLDVAFRRAAAPKPEQPEAGGEKCSGCHGTGLRGFGHPGIGECPDCNGTGKRTPDEVSTDKLTDAEITIARALDALRVNPDGCGFVPRAWLDRIRAFRDRVNQQPEAGGEGHTGCEGCDHAIPGALARYAPCPGCSRNPQRPGTENHPLRDLYRTTCNGTGKRTPPEPKLDDMTDAECDAELRAIGVDPEEVKVRGRVFADTLKENARLRAEVAAKPADERLREAVERIANEIESEWSGYWAERLRAALEISAALADTGGKGGE